MTEATKSQIAMWRAAVALAWADHAFTPDEKDRLTQFFDSNIVLSDAQKKLLKADLDVRPDFDAMWNDIASKEDRAHLINIAALIFESDDHYSAAEKAAYEKMLSDHMASLDVNTAMEIAKLAETQRKRRLADDAEHMQKLSRAGRFIYSLEEKFLG